ncbi:MAG: CPBP family intramembrane metalloprotease [Eubacteriaceae bacterium]|nr:CPBP family intramembrane metalloprotease [Eubacteriaceae bacterium]
MENRRPLIWQQGLLTAAAAAAIWFPQKYLGGRLGLYSTLISEILILIISIAYVKITRGELSDAFSIKRPTGRELGGTFVVYIGGYLAIMALTLLMAYLFPEKYYSVQSGLQDAIFGGSIPTAVVFLIASVSPAVCEEALFRGTFSYSFRGLKKWIVIAVSASAFGILHMDPIRFVPTSMLGAMFMLIYLETGNMLYPMLLHFLNNAISSIVSMNSVPQDTTVLYIPLMSVGAYFIIAAFSPFIIRAGVKLLRPRPERLTYTAPVPGQKAPSDPEKRLAFTVALLFAFSGAFMISSDDRLENPAFTYETSISARAGDRVVTDVTFTADKATVYAFSCDVSVSRGIATVYVTDEAGEKLGEVSFRDSYSGVSSLMLDEGTIHIIVEIHVDDVWEYCREKDLGYSEDADLILLGMNVPEDEPVEVTVKFEIH